MTNNHSNFFTSTMNKKANPIFFNHVRTTFEHEIQHAYASSDVQVFRSLDKSVTHFRHAQGHQRAGELLGLIFLFKKQLMR